MWLPELMNGNASNKLLKFIEEPPDKTVFLLVAEDQEQIIATIRSRTQIVKLPRLKEIEVATYLETEKGITATIVNNSSFSRRRCRKSSSFNF